MQGTVGDGLDHVPGFTHGGGPVLHDHLGATRERGIELAELWLVGSLGDDARSVRPHTTTSVNERISANAALWASACGPVPNTTSLVVSFGAR